MHGFLKTGFASARPAGTTRTAQGNMDKKQVFSLWYVLLALIVLVTLKDFTGGEMWNYLPSVERVIKIPPSMVLQPWMGSDLTNDDLLVRKRDFMPLRQEHFSERGELVRVLSFPEVRSVGGGRTLPSH